MKDETDGISLKASVGGKSKTFTLITEDNHESKKQKTLIKMLLMTN